MTLYHHPIWTLTAEEVYEASDTSVQGLAEDEVVFRLKQYGYNELPETTRRSLLLRFTDQLTHFMALLLWVAGILAFISGTPELGWAIWAVIWINAAFSFWQEYQAEQARSYGYGITTLQAVSPVILAHSASATTLAIYHQATTVTWLTDKSLISASSNAYQ